jgi:hypothetical protein
MSNTILEGFSVSHAAILNGSTGAEAADVYAVRDGTLNVDTGSYDNTGDDSVLSTWAWFNFATVSVTAGYVSFDVIALLQGTTVTSSGTAPNDYYSQPLWNVGALNQSPKPLLIRVPAKDSTGIVRNLDIILYRVQFDPIKFQGPQYKNGLIIDYGGKALMSSVDEKGAALAERAIGRIISHT